MVRALDGVRVVEFCDELGSYAGRLLADLGAEVVKVEPPRGGIERNSGPYIGDRPGPDTAIPFWVHNTSKRSVVLDLESADGQAAAKELALTADIIIEDNPVGWLAARGLGFEALSAENPRLVYVSVTGFGQTGPHAHYAYSDIVGQAMGGVMTLAGDPLDPPNLLYGKQSDISASIHAAMGALAALRVAEATGEGQWVDTSAQEAMSMSQETAMQQWDFQKHNRVRTGGLGRSIISIPGYGLYETKDGHVFAMVAGLAGAGFTELVKWMREQGMHEDMDEEPYAGYASGMSMREILPLFADPAAAAKVAPILKHMDEIVARFFKTMTAEEVYVTGQGRRMLLGIVSTPADLGRNQQLRGRNWFVKLPSPNGGEIEFPGAPYRLSATPVQISAPPKLGQDTVPAFVPRAVRPAVGRAALPKRPLDGLRVTDCSWFGAGPIAGMYMACLGAEVVRLESEAKLDGLRVAAPAALNPDGSSKTGYNISGYFNNFNPAKLSMQLNLNTEKGQEIAYRLIERSDVFLTNFTPRVIDKWRLGYEDVLRVNPNIIAAYAPMQGMEGPHRDYLGFGGVLTPVTGFSAMSGFPHRPPIGVGTNYPDYVINPGHITVAILAALRHRGLHGAGQWVDLPQVESVVNALGTAVAEHLANGTNPTRAGNRSVSASPHGVFRCQDDPESVDSPDRWLAIACRTDAEWAAACDTFGHPEAATDARFATFAARKANEDALEALIGEWTPGWKAEAAMDALQSRGVPAGVVQTAQDMLDRDPHLQARGYYQYLDHPETGRSAYDILAARFSKTPVFHAAPAPLFGEHTFDVCERVLGMSVDDITELLAEGILA